MAKTDINQVRKRLIKKYGLPENASDDQINEAIYQAPMTPPGMRAHIKALEKAKKSVSTIYPVEREGPRIDEPVDQPEYKTNK